MNDLVPAEQAGAAVSGPEHYRAAGRLLVVAQRHMTEESGDMRLAEVAAARAQVHATLAAAAATAMSTVVEMMGDDQQVTEWGRALGWVGTAS